GGERFLVPAQAKHEIVVLVRRLLARVRTCGEIHPDGGRQRSEVVIRASGWQRKGAWLAVSKFAHRSRCSGSSSRLYFASVTLSQLVRCSNCRSCGSKPAVTVVSDRPSADTE